MITSQYCVTMAQYNSWMNAKMYILCATLADEERKRDHRAFFRSIHSTLNHILAVDVMLLSHFTHGTPTFLPVGDLYENFQELRQRREEVDVAMLEWSRSVPVDWLAAPSPYTHHGDGLPRTVTRGFWVVQMFNHTDASSRSDHHSADAAWTRYWLDRPAYVRSSARCYGRLT